MKRILFLILLGFSILQMRAEDVNQQQALSIATRFASSNIKGQRAKIKGVSDAAVLQLTLAYVGRTSQSASSTKSFRASRAADDSPAAFYVFNRGGGRGWIIVSGNEATIDPILAFSDEGDFSYETASENLQWLLSNYATIINKARADGIRPQWDARKAVPKPPTIIVKPLLPVNYDQSTPYNDQCPIVNGTRCPTGCVATAVAQIMRYWKWPKQGMGEHTNTSKTGEHRDFRHTYAWDDSNESLATLMADVGTASNMQYTPTESGAKPDDAMAALVRYFRYSDEMYRGGGNNDLLRQELDAGRPVFYVGHKYIDIENINIDNLPQISSRDSHAFVCDGYADQDFFHFNFGWGGIDNGWHRTNLILLRADEYSLWLSSMMNLHPSYNTRFEKDGCLYEVVDDTHARIIDATGTENLIIRSQVEWEGKTYQLPTTIQDGVFGNLEGVKQVVIEEGITAIAPYAFAATKIESVSFPSTLTHIDRNAFRECNNLKTVTIPSQTTVGPNAFCDCKELKDIIIEDGVTTIADSAFISCGVERLRLPKGIKIGTKAFGICKKLKSIENLTFIKEVGEHAFLSCPINSVNELKFEQIEKIGVGAFENTNIARKVSLPATTQFVGTHAFRTKYPGMQSIFEGYVVDENNPHLRHSAEGMLLSKDGKVLYSCAQGEVVPEGVERIAAQAFDQSINNITLPNTLKEIDSLVFHHYDIRNIHIYATTPPRMHPMALAGGKPYVYTKLYVPDGALEAYKYAPIWNTFGEIIDDLDTCYTKPLPADSALACHAYKKSGNKEFRYDFDLYPFTIYYKKEYQQWDESTGTYKTVSGYTFHGNPINGNMSDLLWYSIDESARISYVVPSTIKDKVYWIQVVNAADEKTDYPITHKGEILVQDGWLIIKDASSKTLASYRLAELQYVNFAWGWSPAIRHFTMEWEEHYNFGYGPKVEQKKQSYPYYLENDWHLRSNEEGKRYLTFGTSGMGVVLSNIHKISFPQNKQSNSVLEKFQYFNLIDNEGNEISLPLISFDELKFEGDLIHFLDMGRTVNSFSTTELKGMHFSKKSALGLGINSSTRIDDESQHLYIHIGKAWKEVGLSRAGKIFTDGASLFIDSIAYPLTAIDSITFERPTDVENIAQGATATHAVSPLCPEVSTPDYALRFSASALSDKSLVKVTPVYPSGLAAIEGVRSVKAYDITLDHSGTGQNTHKLHGVMEIRIPFTKRKGYDVLASYFNEADSVRAWRPICHHYDSVRQEMVILSNHLTRFGIFDIEHENSRNAQIKYFSAYDIPPLGDNWEKTANNLLELAQRVTEKPDETKAMLDWMAEKYSTASTFGLDMGYNFAQSLGYSNKLLDDFEDHIAFLGATVAAYQVYSAALDGKMEEVAGGTINLALNQMTTYAGKFLGGPIWAASMFSVAMINYSLNKFGETAWQGRTDKYRAAYHLYYGQGEPGYRTQAEWVSLLWPVVHNKRLTKERLDAAVDNLVRRHCDKFWTIGADEQAHYIASTGLWWTGWGGLNPKMEQTISDEYRSELYRTDIAKAMETICDSMRYEAYDESCRAMERYQKLMNKIVTISFKDSSLKNDSSMYADCTVRFANLPANIEDPQLWETKLDKQGKGKIQFRIFAQVYNKIEPRMVVVDSKGEILKRLDLEIDYKTTVDLSQDNTLGFDPKHPEDMKLNVVMTPDSLVYEEGVIMRGGFWDTNIATGEPRFIEYQSTLNWLRIYFRNLYGDIAELMTEYSELLAQTPSANTRIDVNGLSLNGTYDAKTKTGSGQFTLKSDYETTIATTDDWKTFLWELVHGKLKDKAFIGVEEQDGKPIAIINALLSGQMTHQLSGTYEVRETKSGKMVYTFKGNGTYRLNAKVLGGFDNVDFHMFAKLMKQPEAEVFVNEKTYEGSCTIDQSFVFGK